MGDSTPPAWLAPDERGIRTAWLTDPNRSSLRGRRLRRAFDRPPPAIDAWPAPWRELLALWVRRTTPDKALKRDSLLTRAGATRANVALALIERLLADGLVEAEEHRDTKLGWQLRSLRFPDPASIRRALALPEPDAAQQAWARRKDAHLGRPDLDAARAALDQLPPTLDALAEEMVKCGEKGEQEGLFW